MTVRRVVHSRRKGGWLLRDARKVAERPCAICGKPFKPRQVQLDAGRGLYCSRQCAGVGKEPARKRKRWGVTFNGETLTLNEWAARLGISGVSLKWRLNNGWSLDMALTEPRGISGPPGGDAWTEGVTSRRPMTRKRRAAIWEASGGICYWCKQPIIGRFEIDHVIALALTGEDEDTNCAPMHRKCHRQKTTQDQRAFGKVRRLLKPKRPSKRPMKGRGFDKRLRRHLDGTTSERG